MQHEYYDQYLHFEQENWWFTSRRRILFHILRKRFHGLLPLQVLDAGCGTGINLNFLREFGDATGADRAMEAVRFCSARNEPEVVLSDLAHLALPDDRFDLVTALDVLEHIEDDHAAFSELVRVTRPGGHLLITVPAFPGLWSDHDEINHHVRRYRPSELRKLIASTNCQVETFTYMNGFLLPVAWFVRIWQQIRRAVFRRPPSLHADFVDYHPVLNTLLAFVFTAELPLVTRSLLPVGLSLVCLVRKQGKE